MRTRQPTRPVLAVALLPALLLAGCATGTPNPNEANTAADADGTVAPHSGGDGAEDDASPSDAVSPTGLPAELTITVDATGEGDTHTWTLTCGPSGGDHPDPDGACLAIEEAGGAAAFAPVPRTATCTMEYGGPQTAHVEGTVDGAPVDADFSYTNGCEISRWDALGVLLTETPTR